MADEREKISNGPNEDAMNETIAETVAGIPDDDTLAPREELPQPPTDEDVNAMARRLGAPTAERDSLPLEGE